MDCSMSAACMQPTAVQTAYRRMHADCSFRLHFRLQCTRTPCSHCSCIARSADYIRLGSTAVQPWFIQAYITLMRTA